MNTEPDKQLETRIHRALRELPPRRAPASLIPRVRAAIATRESRAWWRQPWWNWPRPMQAASLACALALLGVVAFAGTNAPTVLGSFGASVVAWLGLDGLHGVTSELFARWFAGPYLIYTAALLGGLYLACIALGSAFYRFILQPVNR